MVRQKNRENISSTRGEYDVVGTSFDLGDKNLNIVGEVKYRHQSFFKLKYEHSLYGFSCGFHKRALNYFKLLVSFS